MRKPRIDSQQVNENGDGDNLFNDAINDVDNALLEQYKLYIGSANQTSSIRAQVNTFFLTMNTIIISFVIGILQFAKRPTIPLWIIFACILGVLISITWFTIIRSYRILNSARFNVIQQLETRLPANIYAREWKILLEEQPKRSYRRLTRIEQMVPFAFGAFYLVLIVAMLMT